MNAKQKLLNDFAQNEYVTYILPLDELELEYETVKGTSEKIAKHASAAGSTLTALKLVREFGFKVNKVILKTYGSRQYVIFKGYPGERKIFRGTRYLNTNPKVVRMAVGPKGIVKSAKFGFVLTTVLYTSIEVFDYFISDTTTLDQLLGTISSEVIKIGIASIASAVAGIAVGTATIVGTSAAVPLLVAVAVGVVTGYVLDKIDEKVGATKALIEAYRKIGLELEEIEYKTLRWFNYFQNNPFALKQLFSGYSFPNISGY